MVFPGRLAIVTSGCCYEGCWFPFLIKVEDRRSAGAGIDVFVSKDAVVGLVREPLCVDLFHEVFGFLTSCKVDPTNVPPPRLTKAFSFCFEPGLQGRIRTVSLLKSVGDTSATWFTILLSHLNALP